MKLHAYMKRMAKELPELNDGIKRRELMAKNLARKDGILLNRNAKDLEELYLDLLANVCTDEMLIRIRDMAPEERFKCANDLAQFGKET